MAISQEISFWNGLTEVERYASRKQALQRRDVEMACRDREALKPSADLRAINDKLDIIIEGLRLQGLL